MRMIILSALFALGVGLVGTSGASAAAGSGINNAANSSSQIEQVQWRHRCRSVRVCRSGPFHRHCHWERICR